MRGVSRLIATVARANLLAPRPYAVGKFHLSSAAPTPHPTVDSDGKALSPEGEMFCFQCEQTKKHKDYRGCTTVGVCGKTPDVAHLQDLLVHSAKGLSCYAKLARAEGVKFGTEAVDLVTTALFSTVTNVNFDASRFPPMIYQTVAMREKLRQQYEQKCKEAGKTPVKYTSGAAAYVPIKGGEADPNVLVHEGEMRDQRLATKEFGANVHGVREMIVYGLKGMATYYKHANRLGQRDETVENFIFECLSFLEVGDKAERLDLGKNLALALKVGEVNIRVMDLLDRGHNVRFGKPTPTVVRLTPKEGKCILVSGHDLHDLEKILEYTKDKDIDVYTHGEMLPAHGYPGLTKFKNFAGHYGGGWQLQKFEFPHFPGPIVITTNCVIEPMNSYKDRLFTLNETGWPGCQHLDLEDDKSLQKIVDCANSNPGYTAKDASVPLKTITVGFGHGTILDNSDKVIDSIHKGELKRIFVVGGCDGSENKRSYFTNLVDTLPEDTVVLTMGCAKYRFNRLRDFGTLGSTGLPRLMDMGQCNDAYGAVKIALALAQHYKTDINSLPISMAISWFEQKAVAVLLSLLHLGVKNIRLGPVMPAFVTADVYKILQEKFNLIPADMRHPADDLKLMMASQ